MMGSESCSYFPLSRAHAVQVAALHQECIGTGFLSTLGLRFLVQLYGGIPDAPSAFGFVAVRGECVIGFIACAEKLGAVYKQTLKSRGLRMAFSMVPRVFNPRVFKRVIETLFYPSKMEDKYPAAEVLSIVVAPEARGCGVAPELMQRAFDEFASRGINKVKVQVWTENTTAKGFYEKLGFRLAGQKQHHENILDVYVADLSKDCGTS